MKTSCILSVLLLAATPALADDPVPVNVYGNVIASACNISDESVYQQVNLGDEISNLKLKTAGTATDWVDFHIKLVDCPSATTKAVMTFHGDEDESNPDDMYRNSGSAKNVAVQVQSLEGDKLGDGKSITGNIVNNAYTYNLHARVYTPQGNASSGTIEAVVTATFVYQ
ncbi:fimbrial protein [Kluyvera genomosp. 1]|uniref:fimbrial protein n=1 Tax=Kluyvera genomosp. 1 TaxID=2774053 RepID=UPI00068B2DFF|nr:fimbrial protein [Kluyvera genomosp. 1]